MARRAYSTEGERVSPPPPGRLAGYLNLAAVHSLERELSLLLINSGKYLGKIYFTTKILFFFCHDVTNVLWRFSPERERVTLQTPCGVERVNRMCFHGR